MIDEPSPSVRDSAAGTRAEPAQYAAGRISEQRAEQAVSEPTEGGEQARGPATGQTRPAPTPNRNEPSATTGEDGPTAMQRLEAWGNRVEKTVTEVIEGGYSGKNPALRALSDTMERVRQQLDKFERGIERRLGLARTPIGAEEQRAAVAAAAAAVPAATPRVSEAVRGSGAEPVATGRDAPGRGQVMIGSTPQPPQPGPSPAQGVSEGKRGRGNRPR